MHKQAHNSIQALCAANLLSQESRHEEEVVVVHPDEVTWAVDVCDAPCKSEIHGLVGWVVSVCGRILGCNILPEEVVKEWPEG
jgi:hypothetical protein